MKLNDVPTKLDNKNATLNILRFIDVKIIKTLLVFVFTCSFIYWRIDRKTSSAKNQANFTFVLADLRCRHFMKWLLENIGTFSQQRFNIYIFTKPCRCIISHHNELFSFGRISRHVRRIPCCTLHFSVSHTESHMLPRGSNRGSISCDCKSPVPVHHPGCRRNRDDGTSGTALLGRSTSGAPSAIPFCNIKLRPGMSTLREAHRRTFGSIGKKKIDAISEANYPVNFVESEQIDSWKIHGSAYFSSRAKVFHEIWADRI